MPSFYHREEDFGLRLIDGAGERGVLRTKVTSRGESAVQLRPAPLTQFTAMYSLGS